jgi:hypothetical protein
MHRWRLIQMRAAHRLEAMRSLQMSELRPFSFPNSNLIFNDTVITLCTMVMITNLNVKQQMMQLCSISIYVMYGGRWVAERHCEPYLRRSSFALTRCEGSNAQYATNFVVPSIPPLGDVR